MSRSIAANHVRVLLLIGWKTEYARQVRHGVYRFARPHRPWALQTLEVQRLPALFDNGPGAIRHCDAVIGFLHPDHVDRFLELGVPIVNLNTLSAPAGGQFPYVGLDEAATAELAVDYFVENGFRNLALFMSRVRPVVPGLREPFQRRAEAAGATAHLFDPHGNYDPVAVPAGVSMNFNPQVFFWLKQLPKPVAVLAGDDRGGLEVIEICGQTGIRVPEEVVVLGIGDDTTVCELAWPPLSSIQVPAEQIGYAAAATLDQMLNGKPPPAQVHLFPPRGVHVRRSSDAMAIEDADVAEAMRFIREHAHEPIDLEAVLAATCTTRRTLTRRFRTVVGRSIYQQILHERIQQVLRLLADTDRTLDDLSRACGFSGTVRMTIAFKQATGMTPGQYRRQFRVR